MNRSDLSAWGGEPVNFATGLRLYARRVQLNGAAGQCNHDSTQEAPAT